MNVTTERVKEIHLGTAYPESTSVYQALLQVWNECEQDRKTLDFRKEIEAIRSNFESWRKGEIKDGAFSWHLQNNLLKIEDSLQSKK